MNHYLDCISVENMRESDQLTIERFVPGRTLMYRAALGVYRAVEWKGTIAIAVGGGNNGGDGYALACILARHHYSCYIVKLSDKLTEDSGYFAAEAEALGVPFESYHKGSFNHADIVVDCLLGTGFQGSLREPWLSAVKEINSCGAQIISVDINSGMNGDTGEADTAVCSDITVTIGYVKRGLVTENVAKYIKKLVVADIGIVLAEQEYKLCSASDYRDTQDTRLIPHLLICNLIRLTSAALNCFLIKALMIGNTNSKSKAKGNYRHEIHIDQRHDPRGARTNRPSGAIWQLWRRM